MINLRATHHTQTGVRYVQESGDLYRWKLTLKIITRLTDVLPAPEVQADFKRYADGVMTSQKFPSVEAAAVDLCAYIERVTGCKCSF